MNQAKIYLLLYFMAVGCLLSSPADAADAKPTKAEKYVLQQIAKGEWANLRYFGPEGKDRTLSAAFLQDLLTKKQFQVHYRGVRIKFAIIEDSLDLERAHIPLCVDFHNCRFKAPVDCRHAVFEKHLSFDFSDFEEQVDFYQANVAKNLSCKYSTFMGPVDFLFADIGGNFSCTGADFLNKRNEDGSLKVHSKANFNGLKVGGTAFFDNATFERPVDFVTAHIGGQFNAKEAKFLDKANKANFNGLKVGASAFFDNATFAGPVDFNAAHIGGWFQAENASFSNKEYAVIFSGLTVGQSFLFENAIFEGPAEFVAAKIEGGGLG
jgi:hypothetical protein